MRTISRDIVSALIFSQDGKLLMGMKDPQLGGVYVDCWHIPGGGVNEGETQLETLRREVMEETGIDISPYKAILMSDDGKGESIKTLKETGEKVMCNMTFYVYKIDIFNKNADEMQTQTSDDLYKVEWVNLKDLKKYKLTPPSIKLFKKLGYLK